MIEYTSGASKTRVWWGDLPDWSYETGGAVRLELDMPSISSAKRSEAGYGAIEMLLPRGGRALYGGLGAMFSPAQKGPLTVEIVIARDQGLVWPHSLAARIDTVYKGLPYEFVTGIIDGVLLSDNKYNLGSGRLRFAWATHGLVGSSRWIFYVLSDSLMGLLAQERNGTITFEELKELIRPADLHARRFYGNWPVASSQRKRENGPAKGAE